MWDYSNGETRYLSNIKDIENYDSETDKIKAFKSSHKTIYSRRDNEVMSDRTSSGQIVDYYYNTAEYQDNVTEEFYADNLVPVGGVIMITTADIFTITAIMIQ